MTVLILGGTAEARALARELVEDGLAVLSSLAGRVSAPALPVGEVRIGGFGGAEGLQRFLEQQQIDAVVDATHPFAAEISRNAATATRAAGLPLLRLARPGWGDHPDAGRWTWVADAQAAVLATGAQRPFLTTGRQTLEAFLPWAERRVLVRVVERPTITLPVTWQVICSRGPYRYQSERQLMLDHGCDVLVTKDSGGSYTRAKLDAAGDLDLPVVVISRPPVPPGVPTVPTVAAVSRWLAAFVA